MGWDKEKMRTYFREYQRRRRLDPQTAEHDRALARARYARNPEQYRVRVRQWVATHRELVAPRRRAYSAKWTAANLDRARAASLRWSRLHKDRARENQARWRRQNPEKRRAAAARYEAKHRGKRIKNPAVVMAARVRFNLAHPGIWALYANRRRARVAGGGGSHTAQEWRDKCDLLGNVCFYCGEEGPLTQDHKTPVSRGGTDNIDNIIPACKSCNSRKSIRTAEEYIALRAEVRKAA